MFVYNLGYIKAVDKLPRTTQKPYTGFLVQGTVNAVELILNEALCYITYVTAQDTTVAFHVHVYLILFYLYQLTADS